MSVVNSNIMDYVDWRGDLGFDEAGLNEVDSLIFSQLIYVQMKPYLPEEDTSAITIKQLADMYCADNDDRSIEQMPNLFKHAAQLLKKMAESHRFGSCVLRHYVYDISEEEESQFSAVTIELPDNGIFVSYSGTDHSVVGWKENFNLSYLDETPGQTKACRYLSGVAGKYIDKATDKNQNNDSRQQTENSAASHKETVRGKKYKLWIGGHSKGGNLAVFAAMHVDKDIQKHILKVFNHDGPGFNHKMISTDGYKRIFDRIDTFLPQSSVVGILLEHVDNYEVVKSKNQGPMQHDVFSWEILGPHIVKTESLDKNSVRLDRTLRAWIGGMDEAQRRKFVDALFSIAADSNFENLDQMSFKKLISMIKAADDLSRDDLNVIKNTIRQLILAGVDVVREDRQI